MLRASCFLYVLHGSSLALTFYSPFCWGDTLIYMDLCEPKSLNFSKYGDIWTFIKILGRWKCPRYLISFVLILLRFSLIFKGFQRLVSWLLHHFYTISAFGFIGLVNRTPIGCLAIRSFIFAARSIVPMHYVWRLAAPIYGASIQSGTTMQGIDLTLERRIRPMMKQINYSI